MLNVTAHQLKILLEVNNLEELLNRYKLALGENELAECLWRLESRDLPYRIHELSFELSSAELGKLGIDAVAQYQGEDYHQLLAAEEQINYYVKFK